MEERSILSLLQWSTTQGDKEGISISMQHLLLMYRSTRIIKQLTKKMSLKHR